VCGKGWVVGVEEVEEEGEEGEGRGWESDEEGWREGGRGGRREEGQRRG
jgi:hypothetical protein